MPRFAVLSLLIILPVFMYWMRAHNARRDAMVAGWAAQNNYEVLEAKSGWFPPLGLMWSTSKYQVVVRVRIYDRAAHTIRNGWLILGSYWFGLLDANAIAIRWDAAS